jgi:hypothetical protein
MQVVDPPGRLFAWFVLGDSILRQPVSRVKIPAAVCKETFWMQLVACHEVSGEMSRWLIARPDID